MNLRCDNTKKLQNRLRNRKKAKQELDKLLYYLQDEKTKGMNGIIRNAWGKPVIEIGRSTVFGAPNSITQKINANGGVVRNYYNSNKEQCKQIANNNENHRKNNFDRGGIHAHDYSLNDKKIPNHKSARAMNTWEILENGDILWKLLN